MAYSVSIETAALLEGYQHPAILVAPNFTILAANQAYQDRYGDGRSVVGQKCFKVSHNHDISCDQAGETCPLKISRETGHPHRLLHIHHTPRGEEHVEVETRPVVDRGGTLQFSIEILHPSLTASPQPIERGMVGRSAPFNRMLELVHRVAPSEVATLLLGESGTGKEMVAQAIHRQSTRRQGAFVAVECSGLTETLFESELFGHEKGAFTGAHIQKTGLVAAARGGTLFLDEIGDIPLQLQVKLLRLLESGTYRRVGSTDAQEADFRLICATHRNLRQLVNQGLFRQDLYYRINVFPIRLPALRDRGDDIALLAASLLRRIPSGRNRALSPSALEILRSYDYPGNVRELRNILERASLLADGPEILAEHVADVCHAPANNADDLALTQNLIPLAEMERRYLAAAVQRHQGDRRKLAELLGVSERTLFRKLSQLNASNL